MILSDGLEDNEALVKELLPNGYLLYCCRFSIANANAMITICLLSSVDLKSEC